MHVTTPILDEVFCSVLKTNELDIHTRQKLKVLLTNGANSEQQRVVNRILHAVRRGWVKVVT